MKKPNYFFVAAVTIDGFIARFPGQKSTDWTSVEDKKHLHAMEAKADVLLLARKSYEIAGKALEEKNCIVLSSSVSGVEQKTPFCIYINPAKVSPEKFIAQKGYKKICVLGGRGAYNYCLEKGLVNEIFLTIEPVVFGEGIGMFNESVELRRFNLVSVKKLNSKGTVLLHYKK